MIYLQSLWMCCGNCWECCACTFKSSVESCICESDIVTSTFQSNRCWWHLNLHVFFFPKTFTRGLIYINRMPNIQYPSKSGTILIFCSNTQVTTWPLLLLLLLLLLTMNCWYGSCPPLLIGYLSYLCGEILVKWDINSLGNILESMLGIVFEMCISIDNEVV